MKAPLVPSFEGFYRAVNRGRVPFPWQLRLAGLAATGCWPDEIGVPTGLGKTSCIDVAVWALAVQADRAPRERTAPTRTWYVVNRRLLVDAAYDHAKCLERLLADPETVLRDWPEADRAAVETLRSTADALRSIGALGVDPLGVVRLRGGAELGIRPPDPSQPALIFATVPMFASRWLFRGYGTSTSMRPVDAALAGIDALVLLDEAHLSRPLSRLAVAVPGCDLGDPTTLLNPHRAGARFVALTATGEEKSERFELNQADLDQPVVRLRLRARKPTELVETVRRQLPARLASLVIRFIDGRPGSSCVVFCNTVRTAREAFVHLQELTGDRDLDCFLLTGRIRDREGEEVRRRVLDPVVGAPAGRGPARERNLIVVATQTLEVGADLDFDYLVTESAGVRALTQRFGRLNRLGDRPHAMAVICHATDGEDPVYGAEPGQVWKRLGGASSGPVDMGPGRISEVLGRPHEKLLRAGELLGAHLWELAKTSCPPPGEAPVEVFFSALDERTAEVSVCWRSHLPPDGTRIVPGVREGECVEVPIGEVRRVLEERGLEEVRRLTQDRGSLETVAPARLRPGDQLVLPATAGFYDRFGWNAAARETVLDVGALEYGILWLDRAALRTLLDTSNASEELDAIESILRTVEPVDLEAERDPEQDLQAGQAIMAILGAAPFHPWLTADEWAAFLESLNPSVELLPQAAAPGSGEARDTSVLVLRRGATAKLVRRSEVRVEAFEELSFEADVASMLLADHLDAVAEIAGAIAQALGLPSDIVQALVRAGRSHDIGKADPRFQRWLNPFGTATGMLAKSRRPLSAVEADRIAAGWPRGGRHELLSLRFLRQELDVSDGGAQEQDLVLHLVASHHGHGRPLVRVVPDRAAALVAATLGGVRIDGRADLSDPDFEQPARFRHLCERYGVWGLALLEAVLRQADHIASRGTEVA